MATVYDLSGCDCCDVDPPPVYCPLLDRNIAGVFAFRFTANDVEVIWPLFYQTSGGDEGLWALANHDDYPEFTYDETYGLFVYGDETDGVSIVDIRLKCCTEGFEVYVQYAIWKEILGTPTIVGGCTASYASDTTSNLFCTQDYDDIVPTDAVIDWLLIDDDPLVELELTANSWADRSGNWNLPYADDVMNGAGFVEDTTFTLEFFEDTSILP